MKKLILLTLVLVSSLFTSAQTTHFGMVLGQSYNLSEVTASFESLYGSSCMCGSSRKFYNAMIFKKCDFQGAEFSSCDVYFFGNQFWKIIYKRTLENPETIAEFLETEYGDYSDSEGGYEYRGISIKFEGNNLHFISNKVTRSMFNSINGGF
ncbi:MAG: hypothetical protein ACRCZY_00600 [Phocaeicola sp.]